MKKVSVIIPVFNAERYVADTLQSVLDQTYKNLEILIIDDGSSDKSFEICQRFKDSRIGVIRQKNRGLAGARNTGIRHATGDYLAFIDADDIWLPEKLEKHVDHFNQSPTVGVSFSYSTFIDEFGNPTGIYQIPRKLREITPPYVLCRNPIGNGSTAVIRREVFEDIKFQEVIDGVLEDCYFDEQLRQAEDLECWVRISTQTLWKIEGLPEPLTLYRVSSQGLSANAVKQFEAIERVIDKSCTAAPDQLASYRNKARAYYMRYTARRAVTLRTGGLAVDMINRSLITDWRILIEEPYRTILTFAAAYLVRFVPSSFYREIEALALKLTGKTQRRRIVSS